MLGALQLQDSLSNKECGSTRVDLSAPTPLAKDIVYIVMKSKLWKNYTSQRNRQYWRFLGKRSFQNIFRHIQSPSRRWNYMHTCGFTDHHKWLQAGSPRQELGQLKLIPTPGKISHGTSNSTSGVELWIIGRSRSFQRGMFWRSTKGSLAQKDTPSISTFIASRIPLLAIDP